MTTAPTLLALDTATDLCSVALLHAGAIHEMVEVVGPRHSENLLPMVDRLLRAHGVRLADCEAIAFGAGPGSFTGLRVACAVAQGLAWSLRRPVIPVGQLEAIALHARVLAPRARRVAAIVDARLGEAYWAVADTTGPLPQLLTPPALATAAALPAALAATEVDTLAGAGVVVFAAELAALPALRLPQARASAAALLPLAQSAFAQGRACAAADAQPLYVRERVALTVAERAERRRPAP